MSYLAAAACIISTAQHARPNVMGQREPWWRERGTERGRERGRERSNGKKRERQGKGGRETGKEDDERKMGGGEREGVYIKKIIPSLPSYSPLRSVFSQHLFPPSPSSPSSLDCLVWSPRTQHCCLSDFAWRAGKEPRRLAGCGRARGDAVSRRGWGGVTVRGGITVLEKEDEVRFNKNVSCRRY